jgi:hypothetical protein
MNSQTIINILLVISMIGYILYPTTLSLVIASVVLILIAAVDLYKSFSVRGLILYIIIFTIFLIFVIRDIWS